jgi:hypothetical protein
MAGLSAVSEAAIKVGVSQRTIQRRMREGVVKRYRKVGDRRTFVDVGELRRLRSNMRPCTATCTKISPEAYSVAMPWEIDGRPGTAVVGESEMEGFALMRDRTRRLIAFHARVSQGFDPTNPAPKGAEEFVISEEAFRPAESPETAVNPTAI